VKGEARGGGGCMGCSFGKGRKGEGGAVRTKEGQLKKEWKYSGLEDTKE